MKFQEPVQDLDLTACEREPIHIPGSIQPHGLLLAVALPDGTVTHASANLAATFGLAADAILGRRLGDVLPDLTALVEPEFRPHDEERGTRYLRPLTLRTPSGARTFDAAIHRGVDRVIVELEDAIHDGGAPMEALYPALRRFVEQLQVVRNVDDLCSLAAEDIRRMTGFDRVLVYRFDRDWNGTVIAESRNEILPSYRGLRFPASDIPAQARELYRRNRLRIIPDADYAPVPIESRDPAPLDLSDSVLRSVSPVHLEYMRNMGTLASMSISILREGKLWGLISCHNKEPQRVALPVRNACDFLTQIFSLQLEARERAVSAEERMRLGSIQARLLGHMAAEDTFIEGLVHHAGDFMRIAGAQGAAVITEDFCRCVGVTPGEDRVRELFGWLAENHSEDVFATDALPEVYPPAQAYAAQASGLLSISISKMHASYIIWFRPEVVQTVEWGGDPTKPVQGGSDAKRLHPRLSFEIWKETVRGRSLPWDESEIEAVKELRNAIVGIVLRRAEELASLTDELRRSNKELEAFSYSVSHDLRAPFRHIVGYAELLKKQEGSALTERGRRFVDTIVESAITAGTLVDNLLAFSQMGRTSLKLRTVDIGHVVQEVRESLALEVGNRAITWKVGNLPTVRADPVMIRLVFENLISNAVKYTRPREKAHIEVGSFREDDMIVFFVRDNGVGFDMAYVGKLFGVFQRLHRMEDFEGTGIGLANARRIVERHGGQIWAEGAVDHGATFFFTLPDMKGSA